MRTEPERCRSRTGGGGPLITVRACHGHFPPSLVNLSGTLLVTPKVRVLHAPPGICRPRTNVAVGFFIIVFFFHLLTVRFVCFVF